MNEEVKEAEGIIESKEEATKKDGEFYWKYKINIEGKVSTMSQWNYEDGKEVKTGQEVLVTWTEKTVGQNTYKNIASIGPKEKYVPRDPKLGTDEQLAEQAPPNSIMHKEESLGSSQELSTNQSIVRQVMYKCTAEMLPEGIPAKEFIEYAKELEKGFYE